MADLPDPELVFFLRLANDTCNESLAQLDAPFGYLREIDLLYLDFLKSAGGIRPATAGILLLNAHALFRAAIRLSLSGQLVPVYMTLRGSIESALYANAIVKDPPLEDIWLKRSVSKQATQTCRNAFSMGKMFQYLTDAHSQEFSAGLREIYDSTIDFGAHPNSHLLLRSTRIETLAPSSHTLNFAYIHSADSFDLRQSLVACADVGLPIFFLSLIGFQEHPIRTALNERALKLQSDADTFVELLGLSRRSSPI